MSYSTARGLSNIDDDTHLSAVDLSLPSRFMYRNVQKHYAYKLPVQWETIFE